MCGLAGVLSFGGTNRGVAAAMADTLVRRGPDDAGIWADREAGIELAHRRLSIIDLSPKGHQPMASPSGRYVIAFNGEVYNHLELRAGMPGIMWRGHSDTESILAAIEAWGVEPTLSRLVGMFAFALWDRARQELHLVRDRLGEKPLYYGWVGNSFVFASELKALRALPDWQPEVDVDALALFQRYGYVPAPHTIYRGVCKLPPGSRLCLKRSQASGSLPAVEAYWRLAEIAAHNRRDGELDDIAATDALENALSTAVRRQMIADVPLGAFLSGGVDSSAVVALMQANSTRPVKTFTIGFREDGFDEAAHARTVARHLGTDHHELYVSSRDALDVVPYLPDLYDEPFADSSQIPTHLVARLARQHVTVALSGDGGDELFGGYNRYSWGRAIWRRVGGWPLWMRRAVADGIRRASPESWNRLLRPLRSLTPAQLRVGIPGQVLHKLASVLDVSGPEEMYRRLVSQWPDPRIYQRIGQEVPTWAEVEADAAAQFDFSERMMLIDTLSYLPDDILVKVDRAAMGVSLETRIPLLDRDIVELAWSLPLSMKIRGGQSKWLLRQVLYRHVPPELIERPKQGFGVPIGNWLRGPLRDWAEALLTEARLREDGFFEVDRVRARWLEHLSGRRNWQYGLWNVLMFQAWRERWR